MVHFTQKIVFIITSEIIIFIYAYNIYYTGFTTYLNLTRSLDIDPIEVKETRNDLANDLKYILQWTSPTDMPFVNMREGQKGFKERNCLFTNCYITCNRNLLEDYTKFDAIAFNGVEVIWYKKVMLPQKRSSHQKYVFVNMESAAYYPACQNYLNEFFNWTWTYKLNSDIRWGYFTIRDKNEKIIGPNKVMHWMKRDDMQPVPDKLKVILFKKNKTAAWFASNCDTRSRRELFVDKLRKILQSKYSLDLDVYGKCGNLSCPRDDDKACGEMIRNDYHFYLALENSLCKDYVTEKLLRAFKFNAIPIVFGGANYSRFLPTGSYLNARKLGVKKLAAKMHALINNKQKYIEFFKWTNHYRYDYDEASAETDHNCFMCASLNDESKVKQTSIYRHFNSWWNAGTQSSCTSKSNNTNT